MDATLLSYFLHTLRIGALLGVALSSCYSPKLDECKIFCYSGAVDAAGGQDPRCPSGMFCGPDRFCHPTGSMVNCWQSDAAAVVVPQDLTSRDATGVNACTTVQCGTAGCAFGSGCTCNNVKCGTGGCMSITSTCNCSGVACGIGGCTAGISGCTDPSCMMKLCGTDGCVAGGGCSCLGVACGTAGCTAALGCDCTNTVCNTFGCTTGCIPPVMCSLAYQCGTNGCTYPNCTCVVVQCGVGGCTYTGNTSTGCYCAGVKCGMHGCNAGSFCTP